MHDQCGVLKNVERRLYIVFHIKPTGFALEIKVVQTRDFASAKLNGIIQITATASADIERKVFPQCMLFRLIKRVCHPSPQLLNLEPCSLSLIA